MGAQVSPSFGSASDSGARRRGGQISEQDIEDFLRNSTIVTDGSVFYLRENGGHNNQATKVMRALAAQAGVTVAERVRHPVTLTNDAVSMRLAGVGCDPLKCNPIQAKLFMFGCYFKEDKDWVREGGEPCILPDDWDCVLAPPVPPAVHPFANLGPILLQEVDSDYSLHFSLDGLSPEAIEQRQKLFHQMVTQEKAAQAGEELFCFHDRKIPNPITGTAGLGAHPNMVLGYDGRHPDLAAIKKLENCFTQVQIGKQLLWTNPYHVELGSSIVNKIGADIKIVPEVTDTHVLLPYNSLIGPEQAYLTHWLNSKRTALGIGKMSSVSSKKTDIYGVYLTSKHGGNNISLYNFFFRLAETANTFGGFGVGARTIKPQEPGSP